MGVSPLTMSVSTYSLCLFSTSFKERGKKYELHSLMMSERNLQNQWVSDVIV